MAIIKKSIPQLVSEDPASRPLNGSEAVHIDQGGVSKGLKLNMGVITVTGSYLIPNGVKTVFVNAASATITLPAIEYAGREIKVVKISSAAGNITVQCSGSNLIIPEMASSLLIREYGGFVNLISATTSYWERDSVGVLSIGAVSDESLILRMTYDDLPEIPDDPAGVTYLSNFATTDGWSPSGGTIVATGGKLVCESTSIDFYFTKVGLNFSGASNHLVCIYFDGPQKFTSAAGQLFYSTTGHGYSESHTKRFKIPAAGGPVYLDMGTLSNGGDDWITSTITGVRIDLGGSIGDKFLLSNIYIGTGEYLPRKDATGNHLIKVTGSVPVPGVSGNGIVRDGVSAYEQTVDAVPMPDEFTFSQWIDAPETVTKDESIFYLENSPSTTGRFGFYRLPSSRSLFLLWSTGTAISFTNIPNYFTGENFLMGASCEWDPSGTGLDVTVYKNGVLFGTYNIPTAVKPDAKIWFFGAVVLGISPATGTFDELRIYARILSAEEHYNLFRSKSRGPVTHVYANALNRGTAPAGASTPGYEGEVRITDTYLYIYTNGAWRRFAVTAW